MNVKAPLAPKLATAPLVRAPAQLRGPATPFSMARALAPKAHAPAHAPAPAPARAPAPAPGKDSVHVDVHVHVHERAEPGTKKRAGTVEATDPILRNGAVAPPPLEPLAAPPPVEAPVAATARASLEEVLPAIVRRIAWSGDAKSGAVRIEFGAGALAGGTLLVESSDGRVRVRLSAPPGVDTEAWRARIAARLAARRVGVDAVEVDR